MVHTSSSSISMEGLGSAVFVFSDFLFTHDCRRASVPEASSPCSPEQINPSSILCRRDRHVWHRWSCDEHNAHHDQCGLGSNGAKLRDQSRHSGAAEWTESEQFNLRYQWHSKCNCRHCKLYDSADQQSESMGRGEREPVDHRSSGACLSHCDQFESDELDHLRSEFWRGDRRGFC